MSVESKRRGRKQNLPARDERKRQILNGARDCFIARGFHGASILDISSASGVSAANIYQYFESKEALIAALAEYDLQQDIQLTEAVAKTDLTARAIADHLGAVFQTAEGLQKCRMRIEVLAEASRNSRVAELVREFDAFSSQAIETAIRHLQVTKEVSETVRPDEAADKICMIYEGLTNRYVINHSSGEKLLTQFVLNVHEILGLKKK